ncbi:MAG: glycosyltransferase family 2 protein [Bacteroidales bacterium]|nr:glycosyltransferase family 2 protein [Bacteroidales bacterium]
MKKISIIIPVYNSKDFIINCLISVLSQTLEDIEAIIVDNCGTDESIEMAREYLKDYSGPVSFKFASTESNSGPGTARNLGISLAEGEYVCFLDSDDTLESDYCRKLYESAKEFDTDLTYCNLRSVVYNWSSEICKNLPIQDGYFDYKTKTFFLTHFISYFTTYIYRREFLEEKGISFPSTRSSEDSCFLAGALLAATRISAVAEPLYNYIIRENSLTCTKDETRYRDKLNSFRSLLEFARKTGYYALYKPELDYLFIKKGYLITVFNYFVNNDRYSKKDLKDTYDVLNQEVPDYKKNPYLKDNSMMRYLIYLINRHPRIASRVITRYARRKRMKL